MKNFYLQKRVEWQRILGKFGFEAHFLDLKSGRTRHARSHRHIEHQHQAE